MATVPVTVPAPESPAAIGPFGRIVGMFFSPKATFQDIVRKPSWLVPLALLMLISMGLSIVLVQRADWVSVSRDQISKNKFAASRIDGLTEDQKEAFYQKGAGQAKIIRYTRGVIGWPILLLFVSLLYLGLYKLIGGARVTFGTSFVICTFAHLPIGLRELLGILVTSIKDPAAIDPENFLASNLAAILPAGAPTWEMILLAFLDVFGIWALILVAIGFSAADPKKLPFGKSITLAVGMSASIALFFACIAWVFS